MYKVYRRQILIKLRRVSFRDKRLNITKTAAIGKSETAVSSRVCGSERKYAFPMCAVSANCAAAISASAFSAG